MAPGDTTSDSVIRLLSSVIHVPESALSIDSSLGKTENWDSFAQLNLILILEDFFATEIPDDIVGSLTSVKAIVSWLGDRK